MPHGPEAELGFIYIEIDRHIDRYAWHLLEPCRRVPELPDHGVSHGPEAELCVVVG